MDEGRIARYAMHYDFTTTQVVRSPLLNALLKW